MRFLSAITLTALLAWAGTYFFQNWMIIFPAALLIGISFRMRGGKAFLAGFLGIFLLWLLLALITDQRNEHILSNRMAELMSLPGGYLFMLVGALIGGIVGGMSGMSGALVARWGEHRRSKHTTLH